jgi:hypothetical protein
MRCGVTDGAAVDMGGRMVVVLVRDLGVGLEASDDASRGLGESAGVDMIMYPRSVSWRQVVAAASRALMCDIGT